MSWKIDRDRYYSKLHEQYGSEFIDSAGFFPDTNEKDFNIESSLDIMCTPLNFILEGLAMAKKPCVLLTTGSFSPIHSGHIEGMIKTKEHLEKLGWNVVGGYIAPDHDEYIKWKLKEEAIPFTYRMKQILNKIRSIEWLTVDPWAGIFQPCAINFTDVIEHLKMYIKKHTGIDVPVVYVCGGDNARFVQTFLNEGYCAVIQRPGYNFTLVNRQNSLNELRQLIDDRIFIVANNNKMSSTDVRKMVKWRGDSKKAIIRCSCRTSDLELAIIKEIQKYFSEVELVYIEDQTKFMNKLGPDVITLDPFTNCKHKLEVSREFDFFGIKKLRFINRPGSESIRKQIHDLTVSDNCFLHDDDIFSGETIKYVKTLLEDNGYNVITTMSYLRSDAEDEIIDLRDFIVGADKGGLVIKNIDGTHVRRPYIYPYVCPFIRSSIDDPMAFSKAVWELNGEYYKKNLDYENLMICGENLNILNNV